MDLAIAYDSRKVAARALENACGVRSHACSMYLSPMSYSTGLVEKRAGRVVFSWLGKDERIPRHLSVVGASSDAAGRAR